MSRFLEGQRRGQRVSHERRLPAEVSAGIEKGNKYFVRLKRLKTMGVMLHHAQLSCASP